MSGDMSSEEQKEDSDDVAWLEALERGDSKLPEIDPGRAEAYQRMQLEISALPEDMSPSNEDWKKAIYAEMEREKQAERDEDLEANQEKEQAVSDPRPAVDLKDDRVVPVTRISDAKKSKRWMGAVASVAAIAAAAVVAGAVWMKRGSTPSTELAGKGENGIQIARLDEPKLTLEPRAGARRSGQPSELSGLVRDVLVAKHVGVEGELRLYRTHSNSTEFVASCGAGCATALSDGKWSYEIRWETRNKGTYRPVFLQGRDLPASSNDLNRDSQLAKGSVSGAPATIE